MGDRDGVDILDGAGACAGSGGGTRTGLGALMDSKLGGSTSSGFG